jgi:hypothetical protein
MPAPRILVSSGGNPLLSATGPVTIGTRVGCDVVLKDPIAAPRHCEFLHDGAFRVRDLGTVSGTWLDGKRLGAATEVRDGSQLVVGSSKLTASVTTADGAPTLTLNLERNAFWWRKAGKGAFDNDPDALVRTEVEFGKFPTLRLANRVALVLAGVLVLAATFVSTVMEPLADPGPLLPSHAFVAAATKSGAKVPESLAACVRIADEQSCAACHTTGHGTPAGKCLTCHDDLAKAPAWRHPYVNDGVLGGSPGMDVDESFCVVCHCDHQGGQWEKPASQQLVGNCAACHSDPEGNFDRAALDAKLPEIKVDLKRQTIATYRFPHDVHLKREIDCATCHRLDPDVRARAEARLPDDPSRQDFADVPYEVCASCHVPDQVPADLTEAQRRQLPPPTKQWAVAWHGTDEGGKHCLACHTEGKRDDRTVFGPEFRTVARAAFTPAQHAAERARYTSPTRTHQRQFEDHARGRECTQCHVQGSIAAAATPPARTFWHALHVAAGALQPASGAGGRISSDLGAGCVSCHQDMRRSTALLAADAGTYHWPADAAAQAACQDCHEDGGKQLLLQSADTKVAPERRAATPSIAFPHDVHVTSAAFGQAGTALQEGCFACHEFAAPPDGQPFALVPRTRETAKDCTQCHSGHDHIAGGNCQQCHPASAERSNSFLVSAGVPVGSVLPLRRQPVPAAPQRDWPRNDGFRHLSPGHVGPDITCATCHDPAKLRAAGSLDVVPIPDDRDPSCRKCHLKEQFHWR